MPSTDSRTRWRCGAGALCAAAVAVTTGCASTGAPPGFLPEPRAAQSDAFGSWLDVVVLTDGGREVVEGELIAIDDSTTWVLTESGIRSFPSTSMVEGRLAAYDPRTGAVGGGAVLGTLSTISNGAFLIFTAPMWIIGGSVAASSQGRAPLHDVERTTPAALARFARFPGGMPEGLDPKTLEGRP